MSSKKITKIEGDSPSPTSTSSSTTFVPTSEAKGKATQLRLFALLSWAVAIVAQIFAIKFVLSQPINMPWIIGLIVVDLAFAILGSYFWKKSNRLDPASEKNKFMFFMQSQLGLIVAVIAFLPLVIFVFTNKNMDGKQKGIIGGIAVVALLIAGITGTDFNPPSVEQYTEQTEQVKDLTGTNLVYWTKSGKSYHLYNDCGYINSDRTTEIFEGTVAQARELKNIDHLCTRCENKAKKTKDSDLIIDTTTITDSIE
ncbi:hypothetical protein ACFSX9_10335 [Flavobacterium ardleyense]|uniref:Uncharacterized protein n=1 Tax=Flavobacterium ardleyense TaxID=2038737 RepID=A0ABW5Z8R9_9FLAO